MKQKYHPVTAWVILIQGLLLDANKNIIIASLKSSENIQMKEDGPGRSVSNNQFSSVTRNKLAMEARESRKVPKFSDTRKLCCNLPKIQTKRPNLRLFLQTLLMK